MSARRTGAWLALAAALLAGCLVCLMDQKETPAAPAEQEAQAVMITDISVGSLAALALSSGGTSTALMVAGDQIILLDKGKICGSGTHTQLMETNAYYRNIMSIKHG